MGRITERREEKFDIKEVWFEPDTGGFFGKSATVYVIGFPKNGNNTSNIAVTLEVPFEKAKIIYKDKEDKITSTLLIKRETVEGTAAGAFKSGDYKIELMSEAIFELGEHKILEPRFKSK